MTLALFCIVSESTPYGEAAAKEKGVHPILVWWRRGESLSSADSVRVGSDRPPDGHSLPTRSIPFLNKKDRHPDG